MENDAKIPARPRWTVVAKSLMKAHDITQEDLIPVFDVGTRGAVGHYLSGRREPSIDQLMRLAKRLGITTSELVGEIPLGPDSPDTQEVLRLLSLTKGSDREMLLRMIQAAATQSAQESGGESATHE